ncbi:MAG TPA: N-acetylglucosamine-6-phosphate deacetylase [Candidatus Dormibacteraeota bacterium]|nr:N-acetylglucosamine-6-phosphate deacetylase [Candidatus Dormibacteraeota bacterium]
MLDLQVNGAGGFDLTEDPESLWRVGDVLSRFGVTAFLPTLVSPALATVARAQEVLAAGPPPGYAGADPLGWHVEGPFISPLRSGAHEPARLRLPDAAAVRDWAPTTGIRMVTLAPELPGALEVVRALIASGVVVSAGHSAATFDEAAAGFDAGIRYVTHLFNAMAPLDHREPGLAGAALADDRVTIGLIVDGLHVHPAIVRLVRRAVGADRLTVVSDAIAALGMPPGAYRLAGRDVIVDEASARLPDGVLAGCVVGLDEAVRNLADYASVDHADAARAATDVPARLIGYVP